jgi:hypothetical protein
VGALHHVALNARSTWQERFHIGRWREIVCDFLTRAARSSRTEFITRQQKATT